jgi:sn-glycerol 3-phosphate transport system substrate-binding protein
MAGAIAAAAPLAGGCRQGSGTGAAEATLWFSYGGKNREVLLALIAQFHAEQREYRIIPTYQGDYFEALAKLRTALAANAAPTVTHVVGEIVPYLVEAGAIMPLDGFEGAAAIAEDLVPALAQSGMFLGGGARPLYALPFNRSTPIAYLNGNTLKELGLEPPRTWDDLRAFARAATRRGQGGTVEQWGYECPVDWWFWVALTGQAGAAVLDDDGTPTLGGEAGVKAITLWQTLVHQDRTMKPPPGRDYNAWQVTNTDFLAGRAAMIWTSTAFLRYLEENAKFPVIAAPLPRDVRLAVPTGGTMFVMPRGGGGGPRGAEAGFAFLRWMMQPAQANAFATQTGYIPVSRAGLADLDRTGYYAAHPNDRVAIDQLAHAMPWPWAPELFRIQREAVQPRLEDAVLTPRDARETLESARRAAREP